MTVKENITAFLVTYGFRIIGAIVIFACGFFLAQAVGKLVRKSIARIDLEPPVRNLIVTITKLVIIALTAVLTVSKMGVDIAPLVAGMGVIGVGIGLATQGVLSNMVAGLLIMFVKPFRVGEYIELLGVDGVVQMINLFSTRLEHFDKSVVVIPNRKIAGEILHNYGTMRQLELQIGVAHDSDLDKIEAVIRAAVAQNPRVLKDPSLAIGVASIAESSIRFSVKPWVKVYDYVAARGELYSHIVKSLVTAGIQLPFPQREIRILNTDSAVAERSSTSATGF